MTLKTGLLLAALISGAVLIFGLFEGWPRSITVGGLAGVAVFGGAWMLARKNPADVPPL